MKYDIIGDIHGHADTLRALLAKLGYTEGEGVYRHPARRVIFVGDFIDRGPKIRETLKIVRAMTDAGTALAVLGNHEFNAIRYHTFVRGEPLRPHNQRNESQHRATLEQIAIPDPAEWADWLGWFKALPLFLDLGGLRVVHAAWCADSVRLLGHRRCGDMKLLVDSGGCEYAAASMLLSGPEVALPEGCSVPDREGHLRTKMRARWFGPRRNGHPVTYRSLILPVSDEVPGGEVSVDVLATLPHYGEEEPPVIFGHYWIPPLAPRCLARNAACVDHSIACKTGGMLTAYRWNGEALLSDANFVAEPRR